MDLNLETSETNETGIYTSQKNGSDETGDGTEANPLKTPLKALTVLAERLEPRPWPTIFVDGDETKYEPVGDEEFEEAVEIFREERLKAIESMDTALENLELQMKERENSMRRNQDLIKELLEEQKVVKEEEFEREKEICSMKSKLVMLRNEMNQLMMTMEMQDMVETIVTKKE
jgi:hypothetical protein